MMIKIKHLPILGLACIFSPIIKGVTVATDKSLNLSTSTSMADEFLLNAIEQNNRENAQKAIAAGANVNAYDRYGITLLHKAANRGNPNMVELLIKNGAQVNAKDHVGFSTPLHWASNAATAQMLIAHGADVNNTNDHGETPLDFAAEKNNIELMKELIEHGADFKSKKYTFNQQTPGETKYGNEQFINRTPAERAAEHGAVEAVKYLMSLGAASEDLVAEAEGVAKKYDQQFSNIDLPFSVGLED